jgi:serine/threonine protein kinase
MTDSEFEFKGRPAALAPGTVLQERYRIVRLLGKGGMGAVYEVVDQRLDTTVALKETFSTNDRLRRQFEHEARLLARLHHPALPRVTDYFAEGDRAFLVMQFIAGDDLSEIISNQPGPFPRNQVIVWADQLLDALIYLHTRDRQIIHRDIKPHNLKLTLNGQIALLDFGLAKTQSDDASTTVSSDSIFGYTRRYSPLEQIQDQGTTPRSDIYALGATLYHLLTGIKPPDALARVSALAKEKQDALKPASEINFSVGVELSAILSRAMALNSEDRYASAQDFREALRQLGRKEVCPGTPAEVRVSSFGTSTVNTTIAAKPHASAIDPFDSYSILKPPERAWPTPKTDRRPALIVAILCVLMVGGLGAFYRVWPFEESPESLSDFASKDRNTGPSSSIKSQQPSVSSLDAVVASPSIESNRKTDVQKRRNRRGERTDQALASRSRNANGNRK